MDEVYTNKSKTNEHISEQRDIGDERLIKCHEFNRLRRISNQHIPLTFVLKLPRWETDRLIVAFFPVCSNQHHAFERNKKSLL